MIRHPNPSTAMATVVVDELARHGIRRAVAAPGSRSTALIVALADSGAEIVMHLDERSAAFRALGHSVSGDTPGVVLTTSGSAVANLLPAVAEAERSAIPLILLTADRPPELVARRTNQTMDQRSVFAGFVRYRVDLGPAVDTSESNRGWRSAVAEAVMAATGKTGTPGPVQINLAFAEPTVPFSDDGRASAFEYLSDTEGRPGGAPWPVPVPAAHRVALPVEIGSRTVVVAGRGEYDFARLHRAASASGIPVLATALSRGRGGAALTAYHHLLAAGPVARLAPDTVVVVGGCGPSDRLASLMPHGVEVIHVDRWGLFTDISGTMTLTLAEDPADFVERTAQAQEDGWAEAWAWADSAVRDSLDAVLEGVEAPTGPGIARTLSDLPWESLVVASSLPIRDVDAHMTRAGWVHSNRGLSGIDGFASTALGISDMRSGTLALTGDLSLLHDGNSFLSDNTPPMVMVVVDNGGGGLFDLLPQASLVEEYERFFLTPPHRDLSVFARFHHLDYLEATSLDDIREAVPELLERGDASLIRVAVDRDLDLEVRRRLDAAGAAALAG